MHSAVIDFTIPELSAVAPGGVPVEWQGRKFSSGPLEIALDPEAKPEWSRGTLDYAAGTARAEFHVTMRFPEFAAALAEMGVDPALTRPVRAVLRSEGPIHEDHSFSLSGRCELTPHGLFPKEETEASVLPGT